LTSLFLIPGSPPSSGVLLYALHSSLLTLLPAGFGGFVSRCPCRCANTAPYGYRYDCGLSYRGVLEGSIDSFSVAMNHSACGELRGCSAKAFFIQALGLGCEVQHSIHKSSVPPVTRPRSILTDTVASMAESLRSVLPVPFPARSQPTDSKIFHHWALQP
jgi:hypothetical protein